jgi:flagellar basal body-associated protein FliL
MEENNNVINEKKKPILLICIVCTIIGVCLGCVIGKYLLGNKETKCEKEKCECEKCQCEKCEKEEISFNYETISINDDGIVKFELSQNSVKNIIVNEKEMTFKLDSENNLYFNDNIIYQEENDKYDDYIIFKVNKYFLLTWPGAQCTDYIIGAIDEKGNYSKINYEGDINGFMIYYTDISIKDNKVYAKPYDCHTPIGDENGNEVLFEGEGKLGEFKFENGTFKFVQIEK